MVIVDHDNISRLIDLQYPICELYVHAVVICPRLTLCPSIGGLMLSVVEKWEQLALSETSPAGLVFQNQFSFTSLSFISKPHWYALADFIMRK